MQRRRHIRDYSCVDSTPTGGREKGDAALTAFPIVARALENQPPCAEGGSIVAEVAAGTASEDIVEREA